MSNLLYKYENPGGYGGAQRLVPGAEGGLINVLEDYPWTLSPKNVKKYIPYIELEEFRQNFSSEIIGLVRNLAGNAQNLVISGSVETTAGLISDLLIGKAVTGTAAVAGERVLSGLEAVGAAALAGGPGGTFYSRAGGAFLVAGAATARTLLSTGLGAARALTTQVAAYNLTKDSLTNINKNITPDMDPYANLYSATPTGFRYKLPYLSIDNFMKAGGQWAPANEKGPVGQSLQSLQTLFTRNTEKNTNAAKEQTGYDILDALDKVAKSLVGAAPGVAAEALKSFTPSTDGESIKITFYLSNTIGSDIKIIQKNWEFLYLLTYQNLPNRRSINLLDPPCLYRVKIPGIKTYPVAIIESLEVTNEGTTRKVNLETGEISKEDGPGVKTIPEVYKVSLIIKSLLTTTQNIFAYSQANEEKINVITGQFSAIDTIFKATKGRFRSVKEATNIIAPPVTPFRD